MTDGWQDRFLTAIVAICTVIPPFRADEVGAVAGVAFAIFVVLLVAIIAWGAVEE